MTYETIDNFLTLAITALLYGTGLWLVAAFTTFVATHDDFANNDGDRLPDSKPVQTQQESPQQPIEAVEPEVAPSTQNEAPKQLSTNAISCEPVNFKLWKVADLRCPKLRESFGIPLREKGQARAHRKTELEALYRQAMAIGT